MREQIAGIKSAGKHLQTAGFGLAQFLEKKARTFLASSREKQKHERITFTYFNTP